MAAASKPAVGFAAMPPERKRIIAVLVISGGIAVGRKLQVMVRNAQQEQRQLCAELAQGRPPGARKQTKISVDKKFLRRLLRILSICVPSPMSKEALLILIQGVLLVSRTLLTDYISRIEGYCGSSLVSQKFAEFGRALTAFAAVGIPAAVVNSGLKYMQKRLELAFQERLAEHLHQQYCSNRAYYAASTLGGMTCPDQRITEDVEKFSFAVSELYSHTFKPLLDVLMFTRSLAQVMGYKGQLGLYAYYLAVAWLLRAISPPLAQMAAQEAGLSGAFRAAHQRLVTNNEEVAFNDPPAGAAERLILNQHLRRLVRYSRLSAFQRFIQQIADGYCVKYFASVTALLVYAAPIYFRSPSARGSQGELTRDYIRSMRLLQNTSRGVGDLILVYKRVSNLASHTGRVSELLEQITALSSEDAEHRELFRRNVSATHVTVLSAVRAGSGAGVPDDLRGVPPPPPRRATGPHLSFYRVGMDSPDGTPLVRELTFEVVPGRSVMLMGPNGSGKSSLFRVLAGLWPLQAGEVCTPDNARVFYLSQRPYLVAGSLRDQMLYPFPPRAVWQGASTQERNAYVGAASGRQPPPASADLDAALEACLRCVELEYLLGRGSGWDQVQPWQETLSGGEKQRLAMARLLYHRPRYAILDECTSAVSADGEVKLYQECQATGITFLSIAHRPALKRFHSVVIHFDGNVSKTGRGWWAEALGGEQAPSSAAPSVAPTGPPSPSARSISGGGATGSGAAAAACLPPPSTPSASVGPAEGGVGSEVWRTPGGPAAPAAAAAAGGASPVGPPPPASAAFASAMTGTPAGAPSTPTASRVAGGAG